MIMMSLKPLIKNKNSLSCKSIVWFLKGNTTDLTIQMFLFLAKINITVSYSYNKYEWLQPILER